MSDYNQPGMDSPLEVCPEKSGAEEEMKAEDGKKFLTAGLAQLKPLQINILKNIGKIPILIPHGISKPFLARATSLYKSLFCMLVSPLVSV